MLSETQIRGLKSVATPKKIFDARGLYLLVTPIGSRLWRFKYRYAGKEKLLSLGQYPQVSLKLARRKCDEARLQLSDGIDPAIRKAANKLDTSDSFGAIAAEWLELQRKTFAPATWEKAQWTFNDLINPWLGQRPIQSITASDILLVLKKIEARGKRETAHRTKQRISQVIRYAIATRRADRDPTIELRGALAPIDLKNRAAITEPKRIGELLRAIDCYQGHTVVEYALRLAPLLFVRPGELRHADWREFDLEASEPQWRIPEERMKMREQHIVPLSTQAVALLRELCQITGPSGYVFPCALDPRRPMSENALTAALRRMGYTSSEMTWHGFRSMASTNLNEQGWHPDLIELQLAHAERDRVRGAYNKALRLADRRKMMQWWSDYLDEIKGRRAGV